MPLSERLTLSTSPTCSSMCVRNAMTSCFTVRSISSIRSTLIVGFLLRIFSAVPAGTTPARSIASHPASSTSSQIS
jgi:hypothetical protein